MLEKGVDKSKLLAVNEADEQDGERVVQDIEEALEVAGGFGRYQLSVAMIAFFFYNSGGYALYPMSYFELMPHFECQMASDTVEMWRKCEPKDFCDMQANKVRDGVKLRIDYSHEQSFYNWVTQYDMQCASKQDVAKFGSFFFVGIMIGSITLQSLSDRIGRKPVIVLGAFLQLLAGTILLLTGNMRVA